MELSAAFHNAVGNRVLRREIFQMLKQAGYMLKLPWQTICQWFRETIRSMEKEERKKLEVRYQKMFITC